MKNTSEYVMLNLDTYEYTTYYTFSAALEAEQRGEVLIRALVVKIH